MIGEVLSNYRITNQIGSGGMGIVYGAEHILLGKRAAIKVLKPERCEVAEIVERFFNEARAASLVKHPGIPEIFDYGRLPEGNAYLVMEMLEGRTLGAVLDECLKLSPGRAVAMSRLIAGTLQATHDKGIVHRDLKPDNVFVVPDPAMPRGERIKILDFGIAKLQNSAFNSNVQTEAGRLMGTPYYMSPEQCRGSGTVDQRTDIYSLGCVMYQMICGHPPFTMRGSGEVLAAHIHLEPKPLRLLEPTLPAQLDELVMQLLAKDADDRPQSMREVMDRLNSLVSYSGIDTPEPSLAASGHMPVSFGLHDTVEEVPSERYSALPANSTTLQSSSGEFASTDIMGKGKKEDESRFARYFGMAAMAAAMAFGIWGATKALGGNDSTSAPATAAQPAEAAVVAEEPAAPVIVRELVEVPAHIPLVALSLDSEPSGARVYRLSDGVELGRTPITVDARQGPGSLTFLIRKTGYSSARVELSVEQDGEKLVTLKAKDKGSEEASSDEADKQSKKGKGKAGKGKSGRGKPKDGAGKNVDESSERGRDDAINPFQ